MKINYKKIAAITSSALMLGMSAGVAAAANYPQPFVDGGVGNSAVVYGTGAGVATTDSVQAANIHTDLKDSVDTSGTSTTVTGETYDLYTSSSKVYMNDSINNVKSTLTSSQLPTVLADSKFDGDNNVDVTQKIVIGSTPKVVFEHQPTSDDDPTYAIKLGTSSSQSTYNATVTFDTIDFTDSDSIGSKLNIFGKEYTVGAGTTGNDLYLYESSQTISLSRGGSYPSSQTVSVDGSDYTIELLSANDDGSSTARIKVTDSNGDSESKTITEDASKRVQGVDIAVNYADEGTALGEINAEVSVGSDKLKLSSSGSTVKEGSDEDTIYGTHVQSRGGDWNASTGIIFQVYSRDDSENSILVGEELVDPVFGSFKIAFNEMYGDSDRETIEIGTSSNNKATLKMTDYNGENNDGSNINWYYNDSGTSVLGDSTGDRIHVMEMAQVNYSEYTIVGNENNAYLVELVAINDESGLSNDYVEFSDVFSGDTYRSQTPANSQGQATIMIGTEEYTVNYSDSSTNAHDNVRIAMPDGSKSASGTGVIYPTIQTSKGAKVFLYEPLNLSLTDWNGNGDTLSTLKFPDGDGYTSVTISHNGTTTWNVTGSAVTDGVIDTTSTTSTINASIGQLTYQISGAGSNHTKISLLNPDDDSVMTKPAIGIFEEKDNDGTYNAMVVKMEGHGISDAGVGVDDVVFTWGADSYWDEKQMIDSDDTSYQDADYYGVITTRDDSNSDQSTATISYPGEQVHPKIYVGEADASSNTDANDEELGVLMVTDSEVSSVSDKNLIIVGGSCINSAAATLVGGNYCEGDFTDATGVGAGEYMINSYSDSTLTSELALVVAGYSATDTANAASYLMTQKPDTSKDWTGSTATEATSSVQEA